MANDEIVAGKLTEIANLLREQREDQEFARQEAIASASESKVGQEEAKQEENKRKDEQEEREESTIGILKSMNKSLEKGFEGTAFGGFGSVVTGLTVALATLTLAIPGVVGLIIGFTKGLQAFLAAFAPKTAKRLGKFFKLTLPTFFSKQFRRIGNFFKSFFKLFKKNGQGFFRGFGNFFTKGTFTYNTANRQLAKAFGPLVKGAKILGKATFPLGGLFSKIFKTYFQLEKSKNFKDFKDVGNALRKLFKVFTDVKKPIQGALNLGQKTNIPGVLGKVAKFIRVLLSTIFKPIEGTFKLVKFLAPRVLDFSKRIGNALGKFFIPFRAILGIFEFVKGILTKETKSEGIFGQILERLGGGLGGLLGSFVGGFADLIKSAITFIIGLIPGTDGIVEFLKSFSFEEMIDNFVQGLFDGIAGFFDGGYKDVLSKIGSAFSAAGDAIMNFVKKILAFTLPKYDKNRLGGNFHPINAAALAADSFGLYKFAGITKTGIPLEPETTGPNAGAQMAIATDMNLDAKAANAASPIVVQNIDGGKTENTNIVQTNYQDNTLSDRDATLSQFGTMPATI